MLYSISFAKEAVELLGLTDSLLQWRHEVQSKALFNTFHCLNLNYKTHGDQ